MSIGLTYNEFVALNPICDAKTRVPKLFGGPEKWGSRAITPKEARDAGCTFVDLVWATAAVARTNPDVERRLLLWRADCSARVLALYEGERHSDAPRNAIIATRQFSRGQIDAAAVAAAKATASASTMEAGGAAAGPTRAAWAAAEETWAAYWAAGAASVAAARVAYWAATAAAGEAAGAAEESWQFDRLIDRLSDQEPEDWPLPARG